MFLIRCGQSEYILLGKLAYMLSTTWYYKYGTLVILQKYYLFYSHGRTTQQMNITFTKSSQIIQKQGKTHFQNNIE